MLRKQIKLDEISRSHARDRKERSQIEDYKIYFTEVLNNAFKEKARELRRPETLIPIVVFATTTSSSRNDALYYFIKINSSNLYEDFLVSIGENLMKLFPKEEEDTVEDILYEDIDKVIQDSSNGVFVGDFLEQKSEYDIGRIKEVILKCITPKVLIDRLKGHQVDCNIIISDSKLGEKFGIDGFVEALRDCFKRLDLMKDVPEIIADAYADFIKEE